MHIVKVWNESRARLIGDHIAVADTTIARVCGLLGKRNLNAGEGLWIRPSSGVHTLGMRFPIDVIGLDKNRRVVKLWSHLVPYRMTSLSWKVHSVLELPSGRIVKTAVAIGDSLRISSLEEETRVAVATLNQ